MRVAMCEAGEIRPERDAGSRAMADFFHSFLALGHDVRLFTESSGTLPADVEIFRPDVILISRPGAFIRLQPLLEPLDAPIIYIAHDLHFVRLGLQHRVEQSLSPASAAVMRAIEQRCFQLADLAIVPTSDEVQRVAQEFPDARCVSVNYFVMAVPELRVDPPSALVTAFVGGAAHAPNRDGVAWFTRAVLPALRSHGSGATLSVFGEWPQELRTPLERAGAQFGGTPADAALDDSLARAAIGIAPLRFGAGMKRKTLHYLSLGLPVVGTDFAVEGLRDDAGTVPGVIVANSAEEWISACQSLADPARREALSSEGRAFVRVRFSADRQQRDLENALDLVR